MYAELQRQEKLTDWVRHFNDEAAEMESWAAKKLEYLTQAEDTPTLPLVPIYKTSPLSPITPHHTISQHGTHAIWSK